MVSTVNSITVNSPVSPTWTPPETATSMLPPDIRQTVLDGKVITYSRTTEFLVQVGKNAKGAYRNRYRAIGSLAQAVMLYNAINIGNGYKKRLVMVGSRSPILAIQRS